MGSEMLLQDNEIKLIVEKARVAKEAKSKFVELLLNYRKVLSPEVSACVSYLDALDGEIRFLICERKGKFYFRMPTRNSLPGAALGVNIVLDGCEKPYSFWFDAELVVIEGIGLNNSSCLVGALVEFVMQIVYRDHNPGDPWN